MLRRLSPLAAVAIALPPVGLHALSGTPLPVAIVASSVVLSQPANAQTTEEVAKIAQAITVRIEGATQGSGVLVRRDGSRYFVLTAWHVVSGQRPGEELDIYTSDGQRHPVEQGSIKRVGNVDMASLSFSSTRVYELARIGDVKSVRSGETVLAAGYPIGSNGKPKYSRGRLVANAAAGIDQGYQLLYTNDTVMGMSGGVILAASGTLIGMHGRGERDENRSLMSGDDVKTGINQGVPISFYKLFADGKPITASYFQPSTVDDYVAQIATIVGIKGLEQQVISLATRAIAISPSAESYFYRAYAKDDLGDSQGAIADYNEVIARFPKYVDAYHNRGYLRLSLGDTDGAIDDFSKAVIANPLHSPSYFLRSAARRAKGDIQGSQADYHTAITITPEDALGYFYRAQMKYEVGDMNGAISDYSQAISLRPRYAKAFNNRGVAKSKTGDEHGAVEDYSIAISIIPNYSSAYFNRAQARRRIGDNAAAIADFGAAINYDPQYSAAYKYRGILYEESGDIRRACSDWRIAASLGIRDAEIWLHSQCE